MSEKVCVITSVHPPFDTRIWHKEALSLAGRGYKVTLIAPHPADEVVGKITIKGFRKERGRIKRLLGLYKPLKLALEEEADFYHLHDPELLLICPWLKLRGRGRIIYDIHEDVRAQIMNKGWIPRRLRSVFSRGYGLAEFLLLRFVDALIVTVEPIEDLYRGKKPLACVHNYPLIAPDTRRANGPAEKTGANIVYVGGLSESRGALEMLTAFSLIGRGDIKMTLAGPIVSRELESAIARIITEAGLDGRVEMPGRIPFEEGQNVISRADIGLALLHPIPNYLEALPTKMLEYMVAGIPVVASDFPLYNKIVLDNKCGLTVDPLDPPAVADAIKWLLDHPEQARQMGANGRQAVEEKYNWAVSERKLLKLYEQLAGLSQMPGAGGDRYENPRQPLEDY